MGREADGGETLICSPDDGETFETAEFFLDWLRRVQADMGVMRLRIEAYNKHSGEVLKTPEPIESLPVNELLSDLEAIFEAGKRYRALLEVTRDVSAAIRGVDS